MILTGWMLAASAQFGLGLLLQGIMATQGPSLGDAREMMRQSRELEAMRPEIERLKRLGRFDEAEALNKRYYELVGSGPLGRTINETMARSRQANPSGVPQGAESYRGAETMAQVGELTSSQLRRERLEAETDAVVQNPSMFFVRPAMTFMQLGEAKLPEGKQTQIPIGAVTVMVEGLARMKVKDYDGAEERFRTADSLAPGWTTISALMQSLDSLRGRTGVIKQGLQAELEAAEKENPRSAKIASLLWRQAAIFSSSDALDRAVDACERALAIVSAGGANTAEYAAGENNLGMALQLAGKAAAALEHYQRSFSVFQALTRDTAQDPSRNYGFHLPIVAANLGLAHWQLGNLDHASQFFRTAFEEREHFQQAGIKMLSERAQLAKSQALATELHAVMTLERAGGSNGLGLQMLLERKATHLELRTRAQALIRSDAQAKAEPPQSEPAAVGPLGLLGRMFGASAAQPVRQRGGDPIARQRSENQDLLREYDTVVQERSALTNTPTNAARIADLDTRIQVMQVGMQKRLDQAQNKDIDQNEMAAIYRAHPMDPQKAMEEITALRKKQQDARDQAAKAERASLLTRVQMSVPKNAALLEMVRYRPLDPRSDLAEDKRWGLPRYGTYVIRPGSELKYVDLGEAGPLDKLIAEFRAALSDPTRNAARDLGRKLDEAVMRPVRAQLGDALNTLFVAPEGALNLIPFGALIDENGTYLLERYSINYLASGRDLLSVERKDTAREPATIFADPAFDEQAASAPQPGVAPISRSRDFRSAKYSRLPGTADEAQALKRILPDAAVLSGTAATETAAKKLAGPRILHIATHGFFLEDLPGESEDPMLRSGLVFAGVNALKSAGDDGVLTALEASNLDLRGTRLVVLSACDTGLGEVKNGEGVFGLRRAFVVAGAESLLMSLWQVSDEATKDLMTSYYTLLSKGESRSGALRQTQIAMLKNPTFAHPYYWAAFIASGETGSMK